MDKYAIAQILREIAAVIEITDENPKKALAYRRAANVIESIEDFNKVIKEKTLESFPGIGKVTAKMITTLYQKGYLYYYQELMQKVPSSLFELTLISGLGLRRIKILFEILGIKSISELEIAFKENKVKLKGFGPAYIKKILKNISTFLAEGYSMLYPQAVHMADIWIDILSPLTEKIEITGALRRKLELLHQIDLIAITKDTESCLSKFKNHYLVKNILYSDDVGAVVLLKQGVKVSLTLSSEDNFPFSLLHTTGNEIHFSELQKQAKEKGYRLLPYSLISLKGFPTKPIKNEKDVYESLELPFIPPELREGYGEIEATKKGTFVHLVEEKDLHGTFHCHTTFSDGHNTLEEMANAAYELGWEYIGISDHSKSCSVANGMSEETLLAQMQSIQQLNKQFDSTFQIFTGIECDILKDGSLDFSNDILKELDFVIVSIHRYFSQEEDVMTARLIKAIENPYTTMVGHLTGRLLRHRPGYQLNIPKILDACVANNKIIELNAYPSRLDMDWRWWIKAKEKGIKCCINPDAHSIHDLHNCHYGINMARKGWLSKDDVINTLSLQEIKAYLSLVRYKCKN